MSGLLSVIFSDNYKKKEKLQINSTQYFNHYNNHESKHENNCDNNHSNQSFNHHNSHVSVNY